MRKIVLACVIVGVAGLGACARDDGRPALAVEREVTKIASERALWPGYDPLSIPLAVFDGTDTYLFRHPSPPEEFHEVDGAYVFEGRHPMVIANTSATIGGVRTATLILGTPESGVHVKAMAAVAVHEGFHVFQTTMGRRLGADETYLFVYPVDECKLLELRRLETEALRRAIEARGEATMAGWARAALGMRRERFAQMAPAFSGYERGIEALEGTATYVEYKASGEKIRLPEGGFDAEAVRLRAYAIGAVFADLLDLFKPGWWESFAEDDSVYLDTLLAAALGSPSESQECAFSASEKDEVAERARADVDGVVTRWKEERDKYESAPGWQVIVEAMDESPLWPQGFDPMNVRRVEGGLLHTRFLRLGNEFGSLEVMGDTVLTEGVGPHPLFNGVRRLVVTGFKTEPVVVTGNGEATLNIPTLTADFQNATVTRSEKTIHIRLGPTRTG
jgi:hypothetical protein